MRPIVLASALLLVLSGCAAAEPESQPVATAQTQSTETTEPTENTEPSQAAESTETEESTEADATNEPEPEPSETQAQSEPTATTTTTPQATQATTEPEPTQTPTPTATPSPTPTPTPTPTEELASEPEVVGYTLAQVAQKNSAAECWVAIDGGVYDLTQWIRSHPGGQGAITQLCGTDGTAQFLGKHGGQSRPSSTLDGYLIGPLR